MSKERETTSADHAAATQKLMHEIGNGMRAAEQPKSEEGNDMTLDDHVKAVEALTYAYNKIDVEARARKAEINADIKAHKKAMQKIIGAM